MNTELIEKSMKQTDEAIAMAQRFHNELVKVEAERDRLREINKELVESLREMRIISRLNVMEDQMRFMIWKTASDAIDKAEKTT